MAKKDIAVTISAADRLLETTTDPLHRQILENYRRHAILEVCGLWEEIFTPEMTVEHPLYYFNVSGFAGNKAEGPEEVQAIYRMLAETGAGVQVVEDERLMVADWGSPPRRTSAATTGVTRSTRSGFPSTIPTGSSSTSSATSCSGPTTSAAA